jgi:multidrug efflux pump subunit AcrB
MSLKRITIRSPLLVLIAAPVWAQSVTILARGAGAEMRQALGTVVFFGMLGVTIFGLLLTPVFFTVIRRLTAREGRA